MPPLVLVAIAWFLGLVAANAWLVPHGIQPAAVGLLCLLPLGAILLWHRERSMRLGGACVLALLLGALRYQWSLPDLADPGNVASYNDQGWVTVEGMVSGYPDERDTWTQFRLRATSIETGDQVHSVRGTVLVRAARFPQHHYGDLLRVSGLLETPPELDDFSYREYLARRRIYSLFERTKIELLAPRQGSPLRRALYGFKDHCRDTIARLLPAPEASLLQGILLGIRSAIPESLYDDFNTTSTSHILVISGANIVIVTALFSRTFGRLLGKKRGYWVTLASLICYVLLVGADTPVVRAAVMGGLYLTGRHIGRGAVAYVSLCAAAVFLTIAAPSSLWDASFQLSLAATLGLILLADPLESTLERHLWQKVPHANLRAALRQIGELAAVTLAPQIAILPLIVASFGRLSLVGPLANLLIAPAQPLIMAWGGAAMLLGIWTWLLPVARVVGWVPWLLLAYTRILVHWMASWPLASVPAARSAAAWLAAGVYGCLAALLLIRDRKTWRSKAASLAGAAPGRAGIGLSLLALVLLLLTVTELPDGRLHVAFLDVGQGDAILITTPHGQQVLVDGGPSPSALFTALEKEMPFWDHSIDLLISTHPDSDHLMGLVDALQRYEVGGWIDNGQGESDPLVQECLHRLVEEGIERHVAAAGDQLELGEGLSLEVIHSAQLNPPGTAVGSNNSSIVLALRHGTVDFLFTGDIEADAERRLVRSAQPLHADVLKIAHHGSAGSSTEEFLAAVDPSFAVISVGADNHSGHPAEETLGRLARVQNLLVLRTDQQGTVEFTSDGHALQVMTSR